MLRISNNMIEDPGTKQKLSDKLAAVDASLADMSTKQGDISQLNTTDKTSVVNALKEIKTQANTNQTSISNNATSIANIGNSSPKGTYASLTALQTAFPTGTTGVYVVTADGGWYYWNGSAWTKGGTYQSTGIADGSVTLKKISSPTYDLISGLSAIDNMITLTSDKFDSLVNATMGVTNGVMKPTLNSGSSYGWATIQNKYSEIEFQWSGSAYLVIGNSGDSATIVVMSGVHIGRIDECTVSSYTAIRSDTSRPALPANGYIRAKFTAKGVDIFYKTLPTDVYTLWESIDMTVYGASAKGFYTNPCFGSWTIPSESLGFANGTLNGTALDMLNNHDSSIKTLNTNVTSLQGNSNTKSGKFLVTTDFTEITNTSVTSITGGYAPALPTTGSYGWIVLDKKYQQVTFALGNQGYLVIGSNGGTSVTVITLNATNFGRIMESTTSGYTQIRGALADTTGAINGGDTVRATISGKTVTIEVLRAGATSYVTSMIVDMTSYSNATGFNTQPCFGSWSLSDGEKLSFLNAVLYSNVLLSTYVSGMTPSWMQGKMYNVMGDSFTARNKYQYMIQSLLNIGIVNSYGIGGTKIAGAVGDMNAMCNRYTNMVNAADLITVLGGVNDFMGGTAIGTMGSTDTTTFYGALKVLIEGLLNKYPSKKIAFFTPTPINGSNMSLTYTYGKGNNSIGIPLQTYVDTIKTMCENYAIPCLDLYRTSGLNDFNITALTEDGLHPNTDGFTFLSNQMAKFLNSI